MPTESNSNGNKKAGGRGGKSRGKSGGKSRGTEDPAQRKVVSEARGGEEVEEEENNCQVCMNQLTVYSVGRCDHTICFICSTRMRVLCQKNECAICRQDMPMVIFTTAKLKFEDIKDNIYPMDRKYKICFETEEIQNSYFKLLSHESPLSPGVSFKTFQQLDKHLRREHELYYCDLCVANLHLFSHERKFYNRKELVEHRRRGDPGDTSFKGHPLCKFCDTRFFDDEELFKHLRTEHFFCFLCDADGIQYFYNDYSELRDHFYADHYLCTEPMCEKNKFVVFRSEIDLKKHRLDLHQGDMSKAASRETRKVELEFSYNSGRRDRERGGGGGGRERREERRPEKSPEYQAEGPDRESQGEMQVPDLFTDFPSLSGRQVAAPSGGAAQSWSSRSGAGPSREEEFPSLPGAPAVSETPGGGRVRARQDKPPAGPPVRSREEEFPTLPGMSAVITASRPTSAESFVKKKTNPSKEPARPSQAEKVDDFPSLPLASKPLITSASARVVTTSKKPTVIKPSSTTIPVQTNKKSQKRPEKSKFSDEEDDYPSLSGPSIQLNNFSKKTVQSSGQDLAYSAAQISSNIKTIDKSFLESQSSSNNATKTSGKVQVNSTMDFPDLGKPQQALDLSVGKKKTGKKQNKKNNNNHSSVSQKEAGKTSLNSICEFLHDDGLSLSSAKAPVSAPAKKPEPKASASVKPLPGKGTKEEVPRPSRMLGNNNDQQLQQPPVKAASPQAPDTEDFPSLGKSSKKIGRTFISVEEKKMMSAPSMWNKNQAGKENVSQASQAPSKPVTKLPPGFASRNRNTKYISPTDFQERNFALITTITDLLGGKSLEFKMFKEISGKFRTGQIGSAAYFSQCKELIEESKISQIFPELLSLLPDIQKQQELFRLQQQESWSDGNSLTECPQCFQISLKKDADRHIEAHSAEDDFPEL